MRHPLRLLPLLLLLPLAGCADALGVGGDCSAEKTEVRLVEGGGPDDTSGPDEFQGDFTEVWRYAENGRIVRVYTFRWGASYSGCEVSGPVRFLRLPRSRDLQGDPS